MNSKKQKINILLLSSITAVLLAACSPQQDEVPGNATATLGVSSVQVVTGSVATRADTKSITSGKLWVGIRASTSASNLGDDNVYVARQGLIYEYRDSKWTCPNVVLLTPYIISLYAYYPQEGYTIDANDAITLEPAIFSDQKDLRYARKSFNNVNINDPDAIFELTHAYARIKLSISPSTEFSGTGKITAFTLKAAKTGETVIINQPLNINQNPSSPGNSSIDGFTFPVTTTVDAAHKPNTDCDVLFPPQTLPDGGLQVSLTIDGVSRSATIPKSDFSDGELKENNQYTVHLEIGANATLIVGGSSVTEKEWEEPVGDFGNIDDGSGYN